MQCNAMQCNAMQCNAMQCNAMQCNTIQYNTIQYNTIQYNTIQFFFKDRVLTPEQDICVTLLVPEQSVLFGFFYPEQGGNLRPSDQVELPLGVNLKASGLFLNIKGRFLKVF